MTYEVLIDSQFIDICSIENLTPIHNKKVLSLVNDYEDGEWMYKKFQRFIWNNISETALSNRERNSLVAKSASELSEAAQKLRLTDSDADISKGSEISEILLYGIMKEYYGALPVVPKIYYKQNSRDNAKGADSVHIVVEGNDFSLWFGESKFYNSIENARLGEIIKSVENSLQTDKIKKENSIITDVKDIEELIQDEDLRNRIKKALDTQESIDPLKHRLHVPILLLHECLITRNETELTDEYKDRIIAHHRERAEAYFAKQISTFSERLHKYSEIMFHIILFPIPEKKRIVNEFLDQANFHKNA